jgi:Phage tail assembly chaperone proteins, E, or 41 or 14
MTEQPAQETVKFRKVSDPITLSEPIVRGETSIYEIVLRKPKAAELGRTSIQELMQARADAIVSLIPRIAVPNITQAEAGNLEPEDLAACAGAIIDFFLTPVERAAVQTMLNGSSPTSH